MRKGRPIHWRFVKGIAVLLIGVSVAAAVGYYAIYRYQNERIEALEAELLERGIIREMGGTVDQREREVLDTNSERVSAVTGSDNWDSSKRLAFAETLMTLEGIEDIPGTRGRWSGIRDTTESDWATRCAAMLAESAQHYADESEYEAAWERIARALELCNVIGVEPVNHTGSLMLHALKPVLSTAESMARVQLPPERLRADIEETLVKLTSDQILHESLFYLNTMGWIEMKHQLSRSTVYDTPLYLLLQRGAITILSEVKLADTLSAMPTSDRVSTVEAWYKRAERSVKWDYVDFSFGTTYYLMISSFAHLEAQCDRLRLTMAIESYQESNSSYPSTLEDLVPDFIDEVPIYPFSGEPFWYAQTDEGYSLHHVFPREAN